MGYSTLLDILGSVVIGGMLLLILLRINNIAVQKSFTFTGDAILQNNLVEVIKLIEYDFRQMGYDSDWANVNNTPSITLANDTAITFLVDGSTVSYFTGGVGELSSTPNPRDVLLYRSVDGAMPLSSNMGVTRFDLVYFDMWGNQLATPVVNFSDIETIQIDIEVEDVYGYKDPYSQDSTFSKAGWRQIRMSTRNNNER